MPARSTIRDRYSFANLDEVLELPDLIAIQRASFDWFLKNGLADTFRDISPSRTSPSSSSSWSSIPGRRPAPRAEVLGRGVQEKDMTYAPIFVRAAS